MFLEDFVEGALAWEASLQTQKRPLMGWSSSAHPFVVEESLDGGYVVLPRLNYPGWKFLEVLGLMEQSGGEWCTEGLSRDLLVRMWRFAQNSLHESRHAHQTISFEFEEKRARWGDFFCYVRSTTQLEGGPRARTMEGPMYGLHFAVSGCFETLDAASEAVARSLFPQLVQWYESIGVGTEVSSPCTISGSYKASRWLVCTYSIVVTGAGPREFMRYLLVEEDDVNSFLKFPELRPDFERMCDMFGVKPVPGVRLK
jgi:hypothetical protein